MKKTSKEQLNKQQHDENSSDLNFYMIMRDCGWV